MALLCKSSGLAVMLVLVAVLHMSQAMAESYDKAGDVLKLYTHADADGSDAQDKDRVHEEAAVTGGAVSSSSSLNLYFGNAVNPRFSCVGNAPGFFTASSASWAGTLTTPSVDTFVRFSTSFTISASSITFNIRFFTGQGIQLGMINARPVQLLNGVGEGPITCTFV